MKNKGICVAAACVMISAVLCSCGDSKSSSEVKSSAEGSVMTTTTTVTTAVAVKESTAQTTTTSTTSVTTEDSPAQSTTAPEESKAETSTTTVTTAAVSSTTTSSVTEKHRQTSAQTSSTTTTTAKKTEPPKPAFSEGTYKGTYSKYIDAMDADVRYDVTVRFSGGSYDYTVDITLTGGMDYHNTENYTGSYTVDGTSLNFTGKLTSGTVGADGIAVTGQLSSFASEKETVTVRK